MRVFVIGDRLFDVAFQTMDGQVHLRQTDRRRVLLHPEEGQLFRGVLVLTLDDAGGLNEHAARSAGRIKHDAEIGLKHLGDERHERNRREELAAVMRLGTGELREEVFVDAPEHVARHFLQLFRVQLAQKLSENLVVQLVVFLLRQNALQRLVVRLDGLHRADNGLGAVGGIRQRNKIVELRLRTEEHGALRGEVLLRRLARLATPRRQRLDHFVLHRQITAVGMAKEDKPHHGHEKLVRGEIGIRPQRIRRAPKPLLNCLYMLKLCHVHIISFFQHQKA